MEYIDGLSITDDLPPGYPVDAIGAIGRAAVDVLTDLHSLPWRELGLSDLGRPDGFLERHVEHWAKPSTRYRDARPPEFEALAGWLREHRPEQGEPGILHNDFAVDDCLFNRNAPIKLLGVLDWRTSTVGDPLLDVGHMLAFWGGDRLVPFVMPSVQAFSRVAAAPSREDLAKHYQERSGRSLEHLNYYIALAFWKLAAVVEHRQRHRMPRGAAVDGSNVSEVSQLLSEACVIAGLA
jgi:aminoglycoside phosphotransferase (APT) family kinase protein